MPSDLHELRSPNGDLVAQIAPSVGMVCSSLRHRGDELLGQRSGLEAYAGRGATFAIPLLHPWANRLSKWRFRCAAAEVDLEGAPVHRDPNGLPIHGLVAASPFWQIEHGNTRSLTAMLDFDRASGLLGAFPFPHRLMLTYTLGDGRLRVETALEATGDVAVPVSYGFHPYLQLPGVPRGDWEVSIPVRRQVVLDAGGLPTGESAPFVDPAGPLGSQTYDDCYTELVGEPFVLAAGGRRVAVRFEHGYPFAQVYAPADDDVVCFEPMTAPVDALVTGRSLELVAPGATSRAAFAVEVSG